ncbi:GNAT family N-acetyltransferase [Lentzea sp. NPDC102401]|uniref:GNAT family N-acetyltransferase n=1 Tax=Lentzea sp. NPDC102401 TaxID=3364128 RepID=UPI003803895B
MTPSQAPVRALLADGTTVTVRELGPADVSALLDLHRSLPVEDRYLRFFSTSTHQLEDFVRRMVSPDEPSHVVMGALRGDRLLGTASYVLLADTDCAEIALVVSHAEQTHGIGTLLLEHLVSLARDRGVRRFSAEVLAMNSRMLRVFTDMGLVWTVVPDGDVVHVDLGLEACDRYLDAVGEREAVADVASLTHVLRPGSIAVVGAGRSSESVGRAVLRNLVDGNFIGDLYAVNPHAKSVAGVDCYTSVTALPEAPDLAVLCVPAKAVPGVAEECGRRGVRAVVVISSGVDADELMKVMRSYDMRLVGPNCLGVSTSSPAVRMNATFAAHSTLAGDIGLVTQSGGIAIGVFVQPMAGGGRELLVGVATDEKFGPLVVTGLGGVDTDVIDDRAAALAPLSTTDADDLLHSFRAAGAALADADKESVRDVLLRVAALAAALPEVVEVYVNPLVVSEKGCLVVDARVRVAPARRTDPFLRRLRTS